jgi:hypothetical protein
MSNEHDQERTYEDGKQYADDERLAVKFETRAVKHEFKSMQEGRPIFYDQEYILIMTPGSRELFSAPVDDHYKARFKVRYDKWKANHDDQHMEGTLLAELPWLTKSQIAELNYSNVHTVEQLANLSDVNAQQFMGNAKLRERAKKYLEAAAGAAPLLKMEQALEQRDLHIQTLERNLEMLKAQVEKMQAKNVKV